MREIAQEHFEIQTQGINFAANCSIMKDEKGDIVIKVPVPEGLSLPDPLFTQEEVLIRANALNDFLPCFVREAMNALSYPPKQVTLILQPSRSPFVVRYTAKNIDAVEVQLENFGAGFLAPDLELAAPGWKATFAKRDAECSGSYGIRVAPMSHLSQVNADHAIQLLWQFLSFCQGHRVVLSDATMRSNSAVVVRQFGGSAGRMGKSNGSWFCDRMSRELPALFSNYYALVGNNPQWYKALHDVLYWMSRASVNEVGSDGALILLQVALERLAWHVLAVAPDLSQSQMKSLDKKDAAHRIAALLRQLRIPLEIPVSFPGLRNLGMDPKNGPATITTLRNDLIHPSRQSRPICSTDRYHASELARWYLELAFLSLCKYEGQYQNRTKLPRWSGDTVDLPWL